MATATLAQYLFYLAIHCASSRFHRLPYRISGRHCIAFPLHKARCPVNCSVLNLYGDTSGWATELMPQLENAILSLVKPTQPTQGLPMANFASTKKVQISAKSGGAYSDRLQGRKSD
ncbi:hypothetical protein F5878DRAFT_598970 [Lentinula raphanica]|uniref:Uncharacterized protein n=1 Tax=Lentinula raphanica TaxID=153919 RepID=A0AA38PMS2_9AGAR|nr:hypothetical protein F5878DRAFT_598970 [Lentinula raphanica]